ncbi:MAG: conjugative transposon protein TraM [Chitinophagaceae bacterium]
MQARAHSPQFIRKRKLFLVLPLLVLPFLTLLFWALGGGKASDVQAQQQTARGGLNVELPDAYLKDEKPLDKLSYYEKAESDSAKLEELMKNDPYYMQYKSTEEAGPHSEIDTLGLKNSNQNILRGTSKLNPNNFRTQSYTDPNEAKVYKKLDELNTALNQATVQTDKSASNTSFSHNNGTSIRTKDVDRLEQMMEMSKEGDNSEDPEINQLNGMMDKILDIQHPERVKEKIKKISEAHMGQVFSVTASNNNTVASLLVSDSGPNRRLASYNGFYSLNDDIEKNTNKQIAIRATVYETQTLVDGSIVKLRLLNDIYVNGVNIPKDNFVFGLASLNGERLNIQINSIRYKNSLFPVQLSVFDMDGMNGIYIPGAITRDVAKQSADRAIQAVGFTTLDPSLGVQAANAGIEAAKNLLSRKAKLVKVTVKAGYQVLLQDEKQKASL